MIELPALHATQRELWHALLDLADRQPEHWTLRRRANGVLARARAVDSVVKQLLGFRETTGDFGTLLYACMDWKDAALGRRSMQLLSEQVMPKLNAALATPLHSASPE